MASIWRIVELLQYQPLDLPVLWHHNLIMVPPQVVNKHASLGMAVICKHRISSICLCNLIDNVNSVCSIRISISISNNVILLSIDRQSSCVIALPAFSSQGSFNRICVSTCNSISNNSISDSFKTASSAAGVTVSVIASAAAFCRLVATASTPDKTLKLGLRLRGSATLSFPGLCTQLK